MRKVTIIFCLLICNLAFAYEDSFANEIGQSAYELGYEIGQIIRYIILLFVLFVIIILLIIVAILRWAFRINTRVKSLADIQKKISDLNKTNNDIRILLSSIEQEINKNQKQLVRIE